MKNSKTGLHIAALLSLFFLFAPYLVHAQEQDPVPWPCRAMDMDGRSRPYPPCRAESETAVLVTQSFDAIIANSMNFDGGSGITAASGSAHANRPISAERRREEFALTESKWVRTL